MTEGDFSADAIRTALEAADRDVRLNYVQIGVLAGLQALIIGFGLRVLETHDRTQVLLVFAVGFIVVHMHFVLSLIGARVKAQNARMLRALELIEQRLGER